MGRIRTIKPAFFTNEDIAECSHAARLCFIGLWTLADRNGRLQDRPKKIWAELFAYEKRVDVDALLTELVNHKLIIRYEVDGSRLIEIVNFVKHQRPHPKEPKSDLPGSSSGSPCNATEKNVSPTMQDESSRRKEISGRRSRKESQEGDLCSEPTSPASELDAAPDPVVFVFPVVAEKGKPRQWGLLQSKFAEYVETFPGIDVEAEIRKAWQWCQDNQKRRKTADGMLKFLSGWLGRCQDRGSVHGPSPPRETVAEKSARLLGINA